MLKRIAFFIFFSFLSGLSLHAQNRADDSLARSAWSSIYQRDSAALARYYARRDSVQHVRDSLKAIGDSLSMVWLKRPDPNRPNLFLDSLRKVYTVKDFNFKEWAKQFPSKEDNLRQGRYRPKGELWLLGVIVSLLLFFGILRNAFSKELQLIFQSVISNRVLAQISKEENLFNSWPFVFLYILFGFTIGTFLFLCARYFQLSYLLTGIQWLISLSLIVLGLFTLKIIVLRLLGFVFNIQKLVRSYVTILYLCYFNAAVLFLPIVVAFSLSPFRFSQFYIYAAIALAVIIFLFQFIRAGAIVISEYRFPIVYLLLYICALEICPLVILFKALRF